LESNQGGVSGDQEAAKRLSRVGQRLAAHAPDLGVPCRFRLLNSSQPNAYSLSCGYIYVTQGLYNQLRTDELLAAALAHEMAHVAAQDGKRPCSDAGCQLHKELRADEQAVRYLKAAGYSSAALSRLVHLLRAAQPAGWADRRQTALRKHLDESRSPKAVKLAEEPAAPQFAHRGHAPQVIH
jgi:predicted Zn-dependent protease